MNRDTNGYSKQFLKRTILRSCVTHLKPCGSQALFERDQMDMYENLEHMLVMHIGPDHNDILALWSIRETWVQRIQRVHVHEAPRLLKQTSLSVVARPQPQAVTPLFNKATDMCWAPLKDRGKCVLYTTMCHMGRQESLAILKSIDPGDTSVCQDYDLGEFIVSQVLYIYLIIITLFTFFVQINCKYHTNVTNKTLLLNFVTTCM